MSQAFVGRSGTRPVEIGAVVAAAALVLFYRVNVPPIYWWDEARIAINAVEMMTATNPLIVTYNYEADLWNTKFPLAAWLSALSMRLFGVNELALRLPAVLAAIGTVLAVFVFTRRVTESRSIAWLAALILLGLGGFVEVHVARTADFDSLLVLFVTLATFSLFFERWRSYALFATLAIFTKGIAGLLMAPGQALYLASAGKLKSALGAWRYAVAALFVVALFLAARELSEPGYLHAVWRQDIARYVGGEPTHRGPWHFYLFGLVAPGRMPVDEVTYVRSAFPWVWLIPFAFLKASRAAIYLGCCLACFLLVISLSATTLAWYVAPAYPIIAVLTALGFHRRGKIVLAAAFVLAAICIGMNLWKIEKALATMPLSAGQRLPYFLRSLDLPATAKVRVLRGFTWSVGTVVYDGPVEFYIRRLRGEGRDAQIVDADYVARPGEIIVECGQNGCSKAVAQNFRAALSARPAPAVPAAPSQRE